MATPRKLRCRVSSITSPGAGVYTLTLQAEKKLPRFIPGQFLHLAIDEYKPSGFWPDSRVFSIACADADTRTLAVTYSVVGTFTTRMEKALQVDSEVWVKLPYGDFFVDGSEPHLLLAGGTGITAYTAFIDSIERKESAPAVLCYGIRRPEYLLYEDVLKKAVQRGALQLCLFCEQEQTGLQRYCSDWPYTEVLPGRIEPSAAGLSPQEYTCYISGPPAMIDTFRASLLKQGVPPDHIRIDAWA